MRMSKEDYLESIEKTEEEFDADLVEQSQRSVKVSFVLDELARTENLSVNQAELSYFVADQAQRMGVEPRVLRPASSSESGQIGVAITEVLRGKAATVAAERVKVTDEAGNDDRRQGADRGAQRRRRRDARRPGRRGRRPRATSRSTTCRSTWRAPSSRTRTEAEADDVAEALAADEASRETP